MKVLYFSRVEDIQKIFSHTIITMNCIIAFAPIIKVITFDNSLYVHEKIVDRIVRLNKSIMKVNIILVFVNRLLIIRKIKVSKKINT